jgi:hypothetical protein
MKHPSATPSNKNMYPTHIVSIINTMLSIISALFMRIYEHILAA